MIIIKCVNKSKYYKRKGRRGYIFVLRLSVEMKNRSNAKKVRMRAKHEEKINLTDWRGPKNQNQYICNEYERFGKTVL